MKKEVSLYLFLVLVAVGVFLAAYYINFNTTGYAVFDDSGSGFAGTFENTTYSGNASAIILDTNQTTGTYVSEIFNATSDAQWNNLTWIGTGALTLQIRNCSSSDCSGTSFSTVDLNNMNLTGQYFQYKVLFDSNGSNTTLSLQNVSVDYTLIVVPIITSVSVQQPSGTKSSATDLPLNYTTVGTGLTCWYNVRDSSDNAIVLDNTTLSGCGNTTFNPGVGEGSYSLTVFANGTSGFAFTSSSFSIDFPNPTTPAEEPATPEVPVAPVTAAVVAMPTSVTALTAGEVILSKMVPGSTQDVKWNVQNSGTEPLSACSLKFGGDEGVPAWLSTPDESYNINPGEFHEFTITINPTNTTVDGTYQASISTQCAETSTAKGFGIQVESKKLDLKIINTERTGTNKIRVVYSLQELIGSKQNVSLRFSVLDLSNTELANATENRTIDSNKTKEFTLTMPINGSANGSFVGNFTLSGVADSEVYHVSVLEPITLVAPTGGILGGFAVLGTGLGTGGYILIIVVIVGLVVAFFLVRRMKKTGKSASRMLNDK